MFEQLSEKSKRTFKLELVREAFEGVLLCGNQSLGLLILIEAFLKPNGLHGETAQSLIFSSTFMGMLASIFFTPYIRKFGFRSTTWIMAINAGTGLLLILSSFSSDFVVYTLVTGMGFALLPLRLALFTEIYHINFPKKSRGILHGLTLMVTQVTTVNFTYMAGRWLNNDISSWKLIMISLGVSALVSNIFVYKMPCEPMEKKKKVNLFNAFQWPFKDRLFGYILMVWFIFGFANLWIYPIRVQYLAVHMELSPATVAILSSVIVEAARLVFIPFWSLLFDRFNFISLRILLNAFLAGGVWIYFHSETLWGIALGSLTHGIGFAGGRVTWGLWVTKMVPAMRSAEYMAVHIALTGLRGLIGPLLGYWVLVRLGSDDEAYRTMSEISFGLMLLSIVLLVPVIKHGLRREKAN